MGNTSYSSQQKKTQELQGVRRQTLETEPTRVTFVVCQANCNSQLVCFLRNNNGGVAPTLPGQARKLVQHRLTLSSQAQLTDLYSVQVGTQYILDWAEPRISWDRVCAVAKELTCLRLYIRCARRHWNGHRPSFRRVVPTNEPGHLLGIVSCNGYRDHTDLLVHGPRLTPDSLLHTTRVAYISGPWEILAAMILHAVIFIGFHRLRGTRRAYSPLTKGCVADRYSVPPQTLITT